MRRLPCRFPDHARLTLPRSTIPSIVPWPEFSATCQMHGSLELPLVVPHAG